MTLKYSLKIMYGSLSCGLFVCLLYNILMLNSQLQRKSVPLAQESNTYESWCYVVVLHRFICLAPLGQCSVH